METLTFQEAVNYSLTGFSIVLVTLAVLWLVTLSIGHLIRMSGLDKAPVTQTASESIDAKTIAVITAAVRIATGGSAKIQDIRKKN